MPPWYALSSGDKLHGAEAERQQQHDPGRGDERRPHDAPPHASTSAANKRSSANVAAASNNGSNARG